MVGGGGGGGNGGGVGANKSRFSSSKVDCSAHHRVRHTNIEPVHRVVLLEVGSSVVQGLLVHSRGIPFRWPNEFSLHRPGTDGGYHTKPAITVHQVKVMSLWSSLPLIPPIIHAPHKIMSLSKIALC